MREQIGLAASCVLLLLGAASSSRAGFVSASSFLSEPAIQSVAVSPDGTLVAAHAFHNDSHGLLVQVVETGVSTPVFHTKEVMDFGWLDDDTILVWLGDRESYRLYDFTLDEWYGVEAELRPVRAKGVHVGLLPRMDDHVLWATADQSGSKVYRAPTSELVEPTGAKNKRYGYITSPIRSDYLVAVIRDRVEWWISDREGIPRAALVSGGSQRQRYELRYRADAESWWWTIGSWEGDDFPIPKGMAANGRDLLVVSGAGRDTRALRRYDVEKETLAEIVWADPDRDVVDVVYDYQGHEVIAVLYEDGGLLRYHHLDDEKSSHQQWAEKRYPGANVVLTSRSADGRFSTLRVSGPTQPGVHYFRNAETGRVVEVGIEMPWLDTTSLAPVESLTVTTEDGLEVESYLAIPREYSGAKPPLVVMPHGGPVGVRDTRDFAPRVQYLASAGFAVLQVNYRGSSGRGQRFQDAGKLAWGAEIEDDIEAAIDRVVAEGRVDPGRVCIFGWSYGGYSALISTTRRPQRYRCAVAGAAPSDLLLLFDSSDFAASEVGRKRFAEIVGDPVADREHLVGISPAYRADEIEVPVLLLHGGWDRRVDVEHAYRMRAMLTALGRPPEWLLIEKMSHSPTRKQWVRLMSRARRFLSQHLRAPTPDAKSP